MKRLLIIARRATLDDALGALALFALLALGLWVTP